MPLSPLGDLPLDGTGPVYLQIYRAPRAAILAGRVAPAQRLPSSRALADDLRLSRHTTLAAYGQLRAEGYVAGRTGAGTFVAPELPAIDLYTRKSPPTADPSECDDRHGRPELPVSAYARKLIALEPDAGIRTLLRGDRLPYDFRPCVPAFDEAAVHAWRGHAGRTLQKIEPASLNYGDPAGLARMRESLAAYLLRERGVRCDADQIVIVAGSLRPSVCAHVSGSTRETACCSRGRTSRVRARRSKHTARRW